MIIQTPTANATLIFQQIGQGTETDPATGNVVAVTTPVEIAAVLTETGNRANQEEQLGFNTTGRQMRGYLLDTPPGDPPYEGRTPCTVNGQAGTFHFTERNTPYREQVIAELGIPIQGSFQTEGGGK
ncbi:MAG: hypothetical protein AAGF93_00195 [Cyanobacteria bacterium P01_H01_bin.105]